MLQFQMVQNTNILLGCGSLGQLGELMASTQRKKALIVCDEGIVKAGILDTAIRSISGEGLEYSVFSSVQPDPQVRFAAEGFDQYRTERCDCVIGVGGGSSMDTAKAINILAYNGGNILDYAKPESEMVPAPGLIVVPTTAGTGSELSDGLVMTDGDTKYPILATRAMAEYAILDPEVMKSLPPHITATTGMDALAHAAEAYTSTAANTFTDMISEKVIETVARWLPAAVRDGNDMAAREHMCIAACLGGWMLRYAHTNAGHSVAHILGGFYHIPHGFACAYALPEVVAFNAGALPGKTKWIGERFGAQFSADDMPEVIGEKTRLALIAFRDDALHIRKASEFNYDPATFDRAAQEISVELFQNFNPVAMNAVQAKYILEKIFGHSA